MSSIFDQESQVFGDVGVGVQHVNHTNTTAGKEFKNKGALLRTQMTDEEKELVSLIAKHHETLSSSLKNDDLIVFEKYVDCFTEYASLIEAQAFEIGFKLALKLLKE